MRFDLTFHRIMRAALAAQRHEADSFRNPRKTFFVARALVAIARHALAYAELLLHDPWLTQSTPHGGKAVFSQHADRVRAALDALGPVQAQAALGPVQAQAAPPVLQPPATPAPESTRLAA